MAGLIGRISSGYLLGGRFDSETARHTNESEGEVQRHASVIDERAIRVNRVMKRNFTFSKKTWVLSRVPGCSDFFTMTLPDGPCKVSKFDSHLRPSLQSAISFLPILMPFFDPSSHFNRPITAQPIG